MSNSGLSDHILKEAVDAYQKCGSYRSAAKFLGLPRNTYRNRYQRAVERGYSPEHDMTNMTPEGFGVKGVSTLYGADGGVKQQWVKTTKDAERQQEALDAAIEAMSENLVRVKPAKAPKIVNEDLLTCYPIGDHHFGMLSWHEETGGDYDVKIAEELLCSAMAYLVKSAPKSETGAILILGDFLHYDNMLPVTTSGNILDADSRYPKIVRAAIRSIRYMVAQALKKHATVRLILEIGNHDTSSTIMLMETFYMHFENEPRVIVDRSPRNCHVFEFGKNLIGTHHGDKIKMDKVLQVVASDYSEMWGRTAHRVIHTGHVHHDHIKEQVGGITESHRILAPKDAYAANGGWRAGQSMKAIYYHKDHGEVGRNTVTPEMLK